MDNPMLNLLRLYSILFKFLIICPRTDFGLCGATTHQKLSVVNRICDRNHITTLFGTWEPCIEKFPLS